MMTSVLLCSELMDPPDRSRHPDDRRLKASSRRPEGGGISPAEEYRDVGDLASPLRGFAEPYGVLTAFEMAGAGPRGQKPYRLRKYA